VIFLISDLSSILCALLLYYCSYYIINLTKIMTTFSRDCIFCLCFTRQVSHRTFFTVVVLLAAKHFLFVVRFMSSLSVCFVHHHQWSFFDNIHCLFNYASTFLYILSHCCTSPDKFVDSNSVCCCMEFV